MMNKSIAFFMFTMGAVVGSAITWRCTKKKYEQIAQEEIDSVKEAFNKRGDWSATSHLKAQPVEKNEDGSVRVKANQAKEKPGVVEYAKKLQKQGYINYSDMSEKEKAEPASKPYVITPDEFGEIDEYEQISLTYYADQVLSDDNDEPIEDVEGVVGFESLGTFGEYEDDSVFVRNDRLKCDYEILLDQRKYSEAVNKRPNEVSD